MSARTTRGDPQLDGFARPAAREQIYSAVSVAGAKPWRRICVSGSLYMGSLEAQDFLGWFKSSLRNENVFDSFWFVRYPLHCGSPSA